MDYNHHIFLSYSRKDTDIMQRIRDDLRAAGLIVWTDEGIEIGTTSWKQTIATSIRETGCLVVILSPDAATSRWVLEELDFASLQSKPIFPLIARGSENEAIPFGFAASQWLDIRDLSTYHVEIDKLIASINKKLNLKSTLLESDHSEKSETLINLIGIWDQTYNDEKSGLSGSGRYTFKASSEFEAVVYNPIMNVQEIQRGKWNLIDKELFLEGQTALANNPAMKLPFSTVVRIVEADTDRFVAIAKTSGYEISGTFIKFR
ncbi:MAG: toll/interleukin-1 receptor domain-containing protein [Anaerolineae bacterium]|nr:toll/interleukin-1 receptor domain-containing protein [Anaerolineae bacterium]